MECKKIENTNSIDELFMLWKQAHFEEENPKDTFPECPGCGASPEVDAFKNSFCPDGVTSIKGGNQNNDAHVSVLFVLKEANVHGNSNNDLFWFNQKTKDCVRKNYGEKFTKVLEALGKTKDNAFGYMNLNKRGGYGRTTPQKLKCYVNQYRDFIKRQIELHAPDVIIFFGCYDVAVTTIWNKREWNGQYDTVSINGKKTKLYYIYHPAYSNFKKSLINLTKLPL